MANTNAAFGFRPTGRTAGQMPNGGMTAYRLASGTASNIFVGDVVKFLTTGYIDKAGASDQMRGVCAKLEWIDTAGKLQSGPYWASGTATLNSADATIWVYDDPNMIFEAQYAGAATAPAKTDLGATFQTYIPSPGGNTSTGISLAGMDITTLNTTSQPWRLLDWVNKPDNDTTAAYVRALVTPALHDFRVNTGI